MYTREEKKTINSEFWNSYGLYMKKYNSKFGRVRWVNYRSNIKDIYFRLTITEEKAVFSIELQHKDDGIRELFYEQFLELKTVLTESIAHELKWDELVFNEFSQPICRMSAELKKVSVYNRDDWQKTFQFFEKRMVGLHEFWTEFNDIFKNLDD